jgi:23S rRNA pseudouridine2605 synthase
VTYGRIEAEVIDGPDENTRMNTWITMTLYEGKNREIRKVLAHLGLRVNRLIRITYGPFSLGELEPGEGTEVPSEEVEKIFGNKGS